jgi:hypothetical protein
MRTSPAGKAPLARRIEYVLREMQDSIRRLEHRTTVQIGHWRIEEHAGELIAFHTGTEKRVVLATKEK